LNLEAFAAQHVPALERDEARHNLLLAIVSNAIAKPAADLRWWSLGRPGACAVRAAKRPIVLGALDEAECLRLAAELHGSDYPGVVGSGETAVWFAGRAEALGATFAERIPQPILKIEKPPQFPGAPGTSRPVTGEDAALFAEWRLAFAREATPQDPAPQRDALEKTAASGDHLFWIVDGAPVSLASIGRRTRNGAVINGVYTPPALRGRGYAGSVTAALVERGYAEGKTFACLYVDRRNPASNRCYAKIGFAPICDGWHCVRGPVGKGD